MQLYTDVPTVLHVRVMAGTGGGPEKTILHSPSYIDRRQYRVAAAYMHPAGDKGIESIREQAMELGCPLRTFGEYGPLDPRCITRLLNVCRKRNVKIWHGHDYKSNLLGLILRKFHPMKLITTAHTWHDDTWRMRLYRRIDQWCLKHYDHVICVSRDLYDCCRKKLGIEKDRASLVHNGIELRPWSRLRNIESAKKALDIDPQCKVLGFTGRLNWEKGLDRVLHAVGTVSQRVPDLQFVLVGDGPERRKLEKQVRDMHLTGVVRFVGWRKPLQAWYEAMDALVLPSRSEGLPNTLLEAMAMGVPVASTNVGGVNDLLRDGICGTVLEEDRDTWPEALTDLLTNRTYRERLATSARQHIENYFTFDQRMHKITRLYDDLLGIVPARRSIMPCVQARAA